VALIREDATDERLRVDASVAAKWFVTDIHSDRRCG